MPIDLLDVECAGVTARDTGADISSHLVELHLVEVVFSSIRRNASRTTSLAEESRPVAPLSRTIASSSGVRSMQPTLYEITRIGSGRLAVMGRPRAGDWAADEFAGLARLGVTDIVSLLESSEARELDLAEEPAYCAAAGIRFHSFPITDRGVPASPESLARLACRLYHSCADGSFAAIHCRAGIGRSGLVSAAVLLHGGFTVRDTLSVISKARGVQVPDTTEQSEWLSRYQGAIARCHLEPASAAPRVAP